MKELIADIVRAIVDHPDCVEITEITGDYTHVFELRVAPDDRGKVIGRRGTTADAIRTILVACSGKAKRRFLLEIIEEQRSRRVPEREPGEPWHSR